MIDIVRRAESPATLASGKYGGADVVEALHEDFFGKCYLCEGMLTKGTLTIDHRVPVAAGEGGDPSKNVNGPIFFRPTWSATVAGRSIRTVGW